MENTDAMRITAEATARDAARRAAEAAEERLVPHHFSAHREGPDSIRLEAWNEDGSHVGTIALATATALDMLAIVASALNS